MGISWVQVWVVLQIPTGDLCSCLCVTQPDEGEIWPSLRGQWRVGKSMGVLQPIHTHTQDMPLTCCRDCSIPRCTFVHLAYLTSSYGMQLSAHTRSPCTYVGCVIQSAEGESQLCYIRNLTFFLNHLRPSKPSKIRWLDTMRWI